MSKTTSLSRSSALKWGTMPISEDSPLSSEFSDVVFAIDSRHSDEMRCMAEKCRDESYIVVEYRPVHLKRRNGIDAVQLGELSDKQRKLIEKYRKRTAACTEHILKLSLMLP